ncbi:MAG: TolC family protein [Verrucomicrobiota bacterium]
MKLKFRTLPVVSAAAVALLLATAAGLAQETNTTSAIDLATALRLAGAQNLDVQIARAQASEAKAQQEQARMQFFPWIAPGVGYRRHEGNIQDVVGNMIETDKQSYNAGGALNVQLDLGDAIYKSLAAKQLAKAAQEGAEAQRQESMFKAAAGYFELSRAVAGVAAASEAVRISKDYAGQVARAADVGIAFKGDVYRAQVQAEKNQMLLRQAQEQQRLASARLAQVLRLPASVQLTPQDPELTPLSLTETNTALASLIARAVAARPELRQSHFATESARAARQGTTVGPLIPTLGARAYFGGLGGGLGNDTGNFSGTQDYFVGLSWRIGPGGLFDRSRTRAATAREQTALLQSEKMRQEVEQQVIESSTRIQSFADQLAMSQRALTAAEQLLKLSRERKEFGTGAVLETIQAEQELTRARLDYFNVLAGHNTALFAFRRALGEAPVAR